MSRRLGDSPTCTTRAKKKAEGEVAAAAKKRAEEKDAEKAK